MSERKGERERDFQSFKRATKALHPQAFNSHLNFQPISTLILRGGHAGDVEGSRAHEHTQHHAERQQESRSHRSSRHYN